MEILYKEEGLYTIGLSWEPKLKVWMIHLITTDNVKKNWSVSEAKRYLKVRDEVRETIKSRGIKEVYGLAESAKEAKYNMLIGAELLPYVVYDENGKPNYLVKGVV